MFTKKLCRVFVLTCFFIVSTSGYTTANNIQFFYSNNNQILDLEQAYQHLIGKEQRQLQKASLHILQQQHMEVGAFKNVLGAYTSQGKKLFTADNSEVFFVSPLQKISREKTFLIATTLAKQLKQESVAVFIPSTTGTIAHIKLVFSYTKPTITEVMQLVHKLPTSLATAFTLKLKNRHSDFESAEVHSIEWLGNNLNSSVIKEFFPFDTVLSYNGESYLVFNTGRLQKL